MEPFTPTTKQCVASECVGLFEPCFRCVALSLTVESRNVSSFACQSSIAPKLLFIEFSTNERSGPRLGSTNAYLVGFSFPTKARNE